MNRRRRYPAKKPTQRYRQKYSNKRSSIPKIKPGIDTGLKNVFASIGVPAKKSFTPDPFQLEALSAIGKTDCLVTAPTGSGKTWIALNAMARIFKKGQKAWYASPLKALSNSKYDEFSSFFEAENVGILTGDRKENPHAPVIVGTTEILRNQLYDAMHHGETLAVDLVILDEAHFLGDEDRGVVWEEIMIYLPPRISLLLLSATIGNAKQIAGWLHKIRAKECMIIEETKRPVPIFPLFLHPCGTLYPFLAHKNSKGKKRIYKKVAQYLNTRRPPLFAPARRLPPFDEILDILRKFNLLPAIFFLKSRADCDRALDLCINDSVKTIKRKNRLAEKIGMTMEEPDHDFMAALIDLGPDPDLAAQGIRGGSAFVRDKFEGGVTIVVEPAHQAFGARPLHACRIQPAGDGFEEGGGLIREACVDLRRIGHELLIPGDAGQRLLGLRIQDLVKDPGLGIAGRRRPAHGFAQSFSVFRRYGIFAERAAGETGKDHIQVRIVGSLHGNTLLLAGAGK